MNKQHKRVKYACYSANMTMSAVGNISPVLFLTFRSLYGISYSLLGMLVLINFVTQLIIDLIDFLAKFIQIHVSFLLRVCVLLRIRSYKAMAAADSTTGTALGTMQGS